jgi:hypothetical protein
MHSGRRDRYVLGSQLPHRLKEDAMARSPARPTSFATSLDGTTEAAGAAMRVRLRGWLLAAFVVTLGGIVTGSAYFAVGGIFALVSDLFALGMGVVGLVLVLGLHRYVEGATGSTAPGVRLVGTVAYVLTIVGSTALVLLNAGVTTIPGGLSLGTQFAGMTMQGAWFVGFALLVLRSGVFARADGWMFMLAGAGYLSFGVAAIAAFGSVAAMAGGFVGVVVYLVLVLRLRAALGRG